MLHATKLIGTGKGFKMSTQSLELLKKFKEAVFKELSKEEQDWVNLNPMMMTQYFQNGFTEDDTVLSIWRILGKV